MKTVILAEKPDQAKKYAEALGETTRGNGYIVVSTPILDGEVIVTWGIGHLVGLSAPEKYGDQYKKWSMDNLPFIPSKMLYEVTESTKNQFIQARKQLETADLIVVGTDPDREGEHIAYSIFSQCSSKVQNTPKKRLWINSMVPSEIQRGFKNLKEGKETFNYHVEAKTRQVSDYLVGMNFTRYFTLLAQSKGLRGVYSVGRVQTPCNSLVVENDLAIKNFKVETFYKIFGTIEKENKAVKFVNDSKYKDKEELAEAMRKYGLTQPTQTKIKSVTKEMKAKKAPKLFNLGGIQSYANKKWKYGLDTTLKIVQSLYAEGYLSYPRTDCNLITTNEFEYLKSNIENYKQLLGLRFTNANLEPRKQYVDNTKVLEHYAIIPTDKLPDISLLKEEQRNIYNAVVRNTVLMFAEDYLYESTVVKVDINGLQFTAKGNVPKRLGWTEVENPEIDKKEKEENVTLPGFSEGEIVTFNPKSEKGETTPPTRLTESSLGGKGSLMEKLDLGTPATRSNVIATLIQREYIKVENTKLYPTEKGVFLYDLTKGILIGKPEMTANWEKYLKTIGTGQGKQEEFLSKIDQFIHQTLVDLKKQKISTESIDKVKNSRFLEYGDYLVEEKAKVYSCKHKKTNNQFVIFKIMSGKKLTNNQVKQLLEKGKTSLIKGFISKKETKYDAYLVLKDGSISFEYPANPKSGSK